MLEDDAAPSIVFIETADARLSAKMFSLGMFEKLFDPEINKDNKPRQI